MKKAIGALLLSVVCLGAVGCSAGNSTEVQEINMENEKINLNSIDDLKKYLAEINTTDVSYVEDALKATKQLLSDEKVMGDEVFVVYYDYVSTSLDGISIVHSELLKDFEGHISEGVKRYIEIKVKEDTLSVDNFSNYLDTVADIVNDYDKLRDAKGYNYVKKYADLDESIMLSNYLLNDKDGVSTFDKETLFIKNEAKDSFLNFEKKYKESKHAWLIKGYNEILGKSNYMLDDRVYSYLNNNGIGSLVYSNVLTNPMELSDVSLYQNLFTQSNIKDKVIDVKRGDLDGDGVKEVVIATGSVDNDNEMDIEKIYLIEDNTKKLSIIAVADGVRGGYSAIDYKIIRLLGYDNELVYLKESNDASMLGFSILSYEGSNLREVLRSTSPSGSGTDDLMDSNSDGIFDGYTAKRWSYDSLNYYVTSTYKYVEGEYTLIRNDIELGNYPKDITSVIEEYVALQMLKNGKSKDVDTRLKELYMDSVELDVIGPQWYSYLQDVMYEHENNINIVSNDSKQAFARLSYSKENVSAIDITFEMRLDGDKWRIVRFNSNNALREIQEENIPSQAFGVVIKHPSQDILDKITNLKEIKVDENTKDRILIVPKYINTGLEVRGLDQMGDSFAQRVLETTDFSESGAILIYLKFPTTAPTHKLLLWSNGIEVEYLIHNTSANNINDKSYLVIE